MLGAQRPHAALAVCESGFLDVLRLVENGDVPWRGMERFFAEAAELGVIDHDEIGGGARGLERLGRGSAHEHLDAQAGRKLDPFREPVVGQRFSGRRRGSDRPRKSGWARNQSSQARAWTVLPRPMSSARIPPKWLVER